MTRATEQQILLPHRRGSRMRSRDFAPRSGARRCARSKTPPPLERWGGDPLGGAGMYRPAHSCGRDPWSR